MKHCEFCSREYSDDVRFCSYCHEYKGLMPGPVGYDEAELDRMIAIAEQERDGRDEP